MYAQKAHEPSVDVEARYLTGHSEFAKGQKKTEVIFPPCAFRTAREAQLGRDHTRISLSFVPVKKCKRFYLYSMVLISSRCNLLYA